MMNLPRRISLLQPSFFLVLLVGLMLVGCVTSAQEERWKPVTRHDGNQVHVVVWEEETLPAIASWYTGSSDNAEAIANANPTLNPLQLRQGDQVFIPPKLLKTRGLMSKAFVDTFNIIPVGTIKTSSGLLPLKTPRIIVPVPYKEKKGNVADVHEPLHAGDDTAEATGPVPSAPPEQGEVDASIHLFGPK